jgi:hypothetical protein
MTSAFDVALEKWGLEITPRYPKPYCTAYSESLSDYIVRFKYMVQSHALVIDFLETHDVSYRARGFLYYDILRMALSERNIDWDEYWAEYDSKYKGVIS